FNADIAAAEHWAIEDPDSTPDMRTRISIGNRLKECANNENFNVHKKNKDAVTMRLFRRLSISINDEPEFLQLLPPFDDSVRDKMNLYKCAKATASLQRFIASQSELPTFDGGEGEFNRALV